MSRGCEREILEDREEDGDDGDEGGDEDGDEGSDQDRDQDGDEDGGEGRDETTRAYLEWTGDVDGKAARDRASLDTILPR